MHAQSDKGLDLISHDGTSLMGLSTVSEQAIVS